MIGIKHNAETPILFVKNAPGTDASHSKHTDDLNKGTNVMNVVNDYGKRMLQKDRDTEGVRSLKINMPAHAKQVHSKLRSRRSLQSRKRTRSMHDSLRGTLLTSQCIGLFPASGLMEDDIDKLRFSWCSFFFLFFVLSLLGQLLMTSMCIYRMFRLGFNLSNLSNIVFYGSALVCAMLFFNLARGWPALICQVVELETGLPLHDDRKVVKTCNITAFLVLMFASVEHILSVLFGLRLAYICSPNVPMLQAYFKYAVPWIFDFISFSYWKGVLTELFNLQSTFMWNFTDVFIMVVSLHLTEHFLHLNRTIFNNKDKADISWSEARLHYTHLCHLVRIVDSRINGLVLISFCSNLFFICLQLFNSLSKEYSGHFTACNRTGQNQTLRGLEHSVYFTYSFSFLMLRALLVSLLAARVHTAARAPAAALYDVPSQAFSVEVQRFLYQVNYTNVALSGLQFFYITRGMILKVAGTIVTYELVLLQFSVAPDSDTGGAAAAAEGPAHSSYTTIPTHQNCTSLNAGGGGAIFLINNANTTELRIPSPPPRKKSSYSTG